MFNMDNSGSWSLGVLIVTPILILLLLVAVAFIAFAFYEKEWAIGGGSTAATLVVLAIVLSPVGYYPYSGEYHQWREVSGTVAKIDKRLIGSGDKMEDKFVIRFDGSALQFGCDDTRCAQVVEGDTLALSCKRAWQYTGTDGYDCRFVETSATAANSPATHADTASEAVTGR